MKPKYAIDLCLFKKIRNFNDGVTFFDMNINLDLYKGDHKPSLVIHLVILNFTIFELDVYNIYHEDSLHGRY